MWEYQIIRSPQFSTETYGGHSAGLNEFGKEGWEIYEVIPESFPITINTVLVYFMKRWVADDVGV